MPYRFDHTDPGIEAGFARIAVHQLGRAARALADKEPAEGIHDARKALKKTRALLRLVRPGLGDFTQQNRRLRDLGRALSPLRDAQVSAGLLAVLVADCGLDPAALTAILLPPPAPPHKAARVIAETSETLAAAANESREWRIRGEPLEVLRAGLARSLRDGHKALRPVLDREEAAEIHEFRKRVKDRWYHARLLFPVWPEAMAVEIDATEALAELLGDYQDLATLDPILAAAAAPWQLTAEVARRRAELLARARPLACRLWSEAPAATAERWTGWWQSAQPSLPRD